MEMTDEEQIIEASEKFNGHDKEQAERMVLSGHCGEGCLFPGLKEIPGILY